MSDAMRPEPWIAEPGWDRLGGYAPYLDATGRPATLDFAAAVARLDAPRTLDPAAVAAYLSFKHLLGDRTLVAGLRRAPWMSDPDGEGGWTPRPLPSTGTRAPASDEIAAELHDVLLEECREYVDGTGRVGLLLSGGMDSRIVAGVLRQVQREAGGAPDVTAFTWGLPDTRDVIYARRVAEGFGWDWRHFELSSDLLRRNVDWAGRHGCEIAPIHLHAMPDIGAHGGCDLVLAGSYGDSVGRAEFSGRRLEKLGPIDSAPLDPFGLMRRAGLDPARPAIRADADLVGRTWPDLDEPRRHEAGQQLHYMRRKLHTAMATALAPLPLRQMFTSPRAVDLMWTLSPRVRDDAVYASLIERLDPSLAEVPWARTGRRYGRDDGTADSAPRQHHRYGSWLREDLGAEIAARAAGERVLDCGLFVPDGVRRLVSAWRRGRGDSVGLVGETVSWLASFDVFLETYGPECPTIRPSALDRARSLIGGARARAYVFLRSRLRD